jgi:hypothetical protein
MDRPYLVGVHNSSSGNDLEEICLIPYLDLDRSLGVCYTLVPKSTAYLFDGKYLDVSNCKDLAKYPRLPTKT